MEEIKIALEAISLYQTQYAQVDKLWGYFSVVSLAIAGFVIGSEKSTRTWQEPIAIVLAYLVFCFGNHRALIAGQKQLEQFYVIVQNLAKNAQLDVSAMQPFTYQFVSHFHLSVIIAVSIGIIIISYLRHK